MRSPHPQFLPVGFSFSVFPKTARWSRKCAAAPGRQRAGDMGLYHVSATPRAAPPQHSHANAPPFVADTREIFMSSTWSYARRVGAFRTPTQTLYCMFESTCESNVFPRTPKESCIAIGTFEELVPYIMLGMSSCIGGMLCGPHGRSLTPMGYWNAWMRAFKKPLEMHERDITLRIGRWRSPLPVDTSDPLEMQNSVKLAVGALRKHGRREDAEQVLQGKELILCMHKHGDILAEIYGNCSGRDGKLPPWLIFDNCNLSHVDTTLAPSLRTGMPAAITRWKPTIYAIGVTDRYDGDHAHYLLVKHDGTMCNASFDGIAMDYLDSVCVGLECYSASYGCGIAAFKALLKRRGDVLASLPQGTKVRVDIRRFKATPWYRERFGELLVALDHPPVIEEGLVEIPFEQLVAREQYWVAYSINHDELQFILPPADGAPKSESPQKVSAPFASAA